VFPLFSRLGLAAGLPSVPAGVLTLQLSLAPSLSACLDEPVLASQQRTEQARDAQAMAQFLAGARAWWAEYVSLRSDFRHRTVKVRKRPPAGAGR
jgi:centrosomal protein CEP76